MLTSYQTILTVCEAQYEIQKSLFIAHAAPAPSEAAAQEYIHSLKKRYYDATHNCSAYSIGLDDEQQKADDDGEPSGTAGRPILEVIKKNNMKNIVVVVTRYFGGIKLGAGGLVRAYSKSAALALQSAPITTYILSETYKIYVDYLYQGPLENQLFHAAFPITDKTFQEQACFFVNILPEQKDRLLQLVNESTRGTAILEACGSGYVEKSC
ncbi:MAG: YigZ family protein [Sporomusaceae bacterium]|nr:YigZ family protein [Sporomusaceae bacterium]